MMLELIRSLRLAAEAHHDQARGATGHLLTEAAEGIEHLRIALAEQDDFILKFTDKNRNGDWACAQCKPHSDMIKAGFVCGYHRAEARIARRQLSEKNRGPLHYPERPLSCASDNI